MKVIYVFSQFPNPPEAFAAVEVKALRKTEVDLETWSLKTPNPRDAELAAGRGVEKVPRRFNSAGSTMRGLGRIFTRPRQAAYLLKIIAQECATKPKQVLLSLGVLPRVLDLMRLVEERPPDVLHLYWGHYPSLLGLLVRKFSPSVLVSMSTGAYDMLMKYGPSTPMIQQADVVSSFAAANIPTISAEGRRGDDIDIFHHGVEIPSGAERFLEGHRNPGSILCVNRLIPAKATDEAIRMVSHLVKDWPEVHLTVMGDGPDFSKLQDLVAELDLKDAVTVAGHVSHRQVLEAMRTSEVLLSMSRYAAERLPNVVKEGMVNGAVVVASRTPGIEDLVTHGETGFVMGNGDAADAAGIISSQIFSRRSELQGLRAAAFRHIDMHFNADRSAAERVERWRDAIAAKA